MFAKLSIQNKLIIFAVLSLGLLATVLQIIWTLQQRNDLEQASRERSITIISNINTTINVVRPLAQTMEDMTELDARLSDLVMQNEHVDFIAVTTLDGTVIFHSDAEYKDRTFPSLANLPMEDTPRKEISGYGLVYLTTEQIAGIETTDPQGYQIIVATAAEPILNKLLNNIISSVIITLLVVAIISVILILMLRYNLVNPIAQLSETAQAIQAGNLALRAEATRHDEIGKLAKAFNSMTDQLSNLINNLEERVTARTRDLQIASDVARQITTTLDIDALLHQVVTLTSKSFDLQAAFIFLLDESGQKLRLTAGSEVINVASADILLTAEPSVIAHAARTRHATTVNDVTQSPLYRHIPDLDKTRSELAIPMMLGDQLLGVFDVQSAAVNRFQQEDVNVLTTLAEQVAIAVRNAQLYKDTKEALMVAERANAVKSQFLASVSHELRTPLNAILNFSRFVATGVFGTVNSEQEEVLNKVIGSGRHLLSLINDVLDISKIEAGSLKLFVEPEVDLRVELEAVADTARSTLVGKPVELIVNDAPDLPAIICDRRRIRQIMLNLVSNACKFTDEGSVSLSLYRQDDHLIFAVKDTGPGIAAEDHELIFESFRQSQSGLRKGEGTGLGLAISRRLAETHEGRLWLESQPGSGSTFYVSVPITSDHLITLLRDQESVEA